MNGKLKVYFETSEKNQCFRSHDSSVARSADIAAPSTSTGAFRQKAAAQSPAPAHALLNMNTLPTHPGVSRSEEVRLRGSHHFFSLDPSHPFFTLRPSSIRPDGKVSLYDFELAYAPGVETFDSLASPLFATNSVPLEALLRVSLAVSSKEGTLPLRSYAKVEALGRAVRTAAIALRQQGQADVLKVGPATYQHETRPGERAASLRELLITWEDLGRSKGMLDTYTELRHLLGPAFLHDSRWGAGGAFALVEDAFYAILRENMKGYKRASYTERAVWLSRFLARSRTPWTNPDFGESITRRVSALGDRAEFHFGSEADKKTILAEHISSMLEEYPNVSTLVQPGTDGDVVLQELLRLTVNKTFTSDLLTESGWGVLEACLEGFVEGVRQTPLAKRSTHGNITLVLEDSSSRDNAFNSAVKVSGPLVDGTMSVGYSKGQQRSLQQLLRSKAGYDFSNRLGKAVSDYEKVFVCLQSGLAPVLKCLHLQVGTLDHDITEELHRLSLILKDGSYYRMSLMVDTAGEMKDTTVKSRFLKLELSCSVIKQLMAQEYSSIDWYNDIYLVYANVKDKAFPLPHLKWPEQALEDPLVVSEMPAMIDRLLHPLYDANNSVSKIFDAAQDYFVAGCRKTGSARSSHFKHYVDFIIGSFREAESSARMYFSSESPAIKPLGSFAHKSSEARRRFDGLEATHESVLDMIDYKRDFFESGMGNAPLPVDQAQSRVARRAAATAAAADNLDDLAWANQNIGLLVTTNRVTIVDENGMAGITSSGYTYQVNKSKAAAICGCKQSDRCWWCALSHKPFPAAVICCPKKGSFGHKSATDTQHCFSPQELASIRKLAGCPDFR